MPRDSMRELALFAGAGGGILGGMLLGWRTVAAVEIEEYPRRVLLQRQSDGILPRFPIWDDVCTFDGKPWRGKVDVISGGFPCQDISCAGKGEGIEGKRSGLWVEMARIIGEVRPQFVFVENSPMLTIRGLGRVLGDLATLGYDARWGVLGADDAGAPHRRKRIWVLGWNAEPRGTGEDVAHSGSRWRQDHELCSGGNVARLCGSPLADTDDTGDRQRVRTDAYGAAETENGNGEPGFESRQKGSPIDVPNAVSDGCDQGRERLATTRGDGIIGNDWWATEPALGRVAHGVAHRVDRLKAIGNGQVSAVARLAWEILSQDCP